MLRSPDGCTLAVLTRWAELQRANDLWTIETATEEKSRNASFAALAYFRMRRHLNSAAKCHIIGNAKTLSGVKTTRSVIVNQRRIERRVEVRWLIVPRPFGVVCKINLLHFNLNVQVRSRQMSSVVEQYRGGQNRRNEAMLLGKYDPFLTRAKQDLGDVGRANQKVSIHIRSVRIGRARRRGNRYGDDRSVHY